MVRYNFIMEDIFYHKQEYIFLSCFVKKHLFNFLKNLDYFKNAIFLYEGHNQRITIID